jgi:hypothetical protein
MTYIYGVGVRGVPLRETKQKGLRNGDTKKFESD